MKSYTDISQSKKLAKILPLETADMAWCNNSIRGVNYTDEYSANLYTVKEMKDVFDEALVGWDKYWKLTPCWSLVALLNATPQIKIRGSKKIGYIVYYNKNIASNRNFDIIDACYEMILKLYELKML